MHTFLVEYYSAIKKEETLSSVASWINLEGIMLSKTAQKRKIPYNLT